MLLRSLFISFCTIMYCAYAISATIIFDINTCFDTNTGKATKYVGALNALQFLAAQGHKPDTPYLFETLAPIKGNTPGQAWSKGYQVPATMGDWLASNTSNTELLTRWKQHILTSSLSDIAKTVYINIITMMLTPSQLVETRYLKKDIAKLIKKLYRSHTILISGNWNGESITELTTRFHKDFFQYTDGYLFSGTMHLLKPTPAFYNHVIEAYNLDLATCINIESEVPYIQPSQDAGFTTLHYTSSSQIEKELQRLL